MVTWTAGSVIRALAMLILLLQTSHSTAKRRQSGHGAAHSRLPMNVTAVAGIDVDLRCKVKLHECGNFYSIEWYREFLGRNAERVYVYRHHTGQAKAEGIWQGRANHFYDSKRHLMRVQEC